MIISSCFFIMKNCVSASIAATSHASHYPHSVCMDIWALLSSIVQIHRKPPFRQGLNPARPVGVKSRMDLMACWLQKKTKWKSGKQYLQKPATTGCIIRELQMPCFAIQLYQ